MALSNAGVTKGGRGERAAEMEEGREMSPRRMDLLARRGGGWGRRRGGTTHEHGASLLQLRNLTSYLLLRSSSAWPSSPSYAHRSKLREHTPSIKNPSPSRA